MHSRCLLRLFGGSAVSSSYFIRHFRHTGGCCSSAACPLRTRGPYGGLPLVTCSVRACPSSWPRSGHVRSLGQRCSSSNSGSDDEEMSDSEDRGKILRPRLATGVEISYSRGLPQITVPLPSRHQRCRFTLKPISNTVADFIGQLRREDRGIDRVVLRTLRGVRIAGSDSIEALMEEDFELIINDELYHVKTPDMERPSKEEMATLGNVRNMVSQLYEALNVEEHQLKKERELLARLEDVHAQLEPMEKLRSDLEKISQRRSNVLTWCGLTLMGVQFGVLARLTWWEYSWDIMEPVTYFVTYGTAMAAYAYFAVTKQDYVLPDVRERNFLLNLYRRCRQRGLDVTLYNQLKNRQHCLQCDLQRLRDPLQIHLPPRHLEHVSVSEPERQFSFGAVLNLLKNSNNNVNNNNNNTRTTSASSQTVPTSPSSTASR